MGIDLINDDTKVLFGAPVRYQTIMENPRMGSSAYHAGFHKEDKILQIGPFTLNEMVPIEMVLNKYNVGDKVKFTFLRFDQIKEVEVTFVTQRTYHLSMKNMDSISKAMIQNRAHWLQEK